MTPKQMRVAANILELSGDRTSAGRLRERADIVVGLRWFCDHHRGIQQPSIEELIEVISSSQFADLSQPLDKEIS